ncbi:MAG: hypothetical protein NTV52_04370 [Acidobacteria bacterium]|nr:hypothetical protein [Acidobacteriota bacterium]
MNFRTTVSIPPILKLWGGTREAILRARFRVQKNDTEGDEKVWRAQAKGVSLVDFAQEVLARKVLPVEKKGPRTGRELVNAGASVRGFFADEEIDQLFSRTPTFSRPVDFS